jgi:histidine ammonia-lyase
MSPPVASDRLIAWIEERAGPQLAPHSPAPEQRPLVIGAGAVTIDDVVRLATADAEATLDPVARERMTIGRNVIERSLARGEVVYGLTAGVGPQKTVTVSAAGQQPFNRLMILAHSSSER